MSTLKADTIQSTSGGAATLTKQHAAKAWVNFTGISTTAIRDSLNISSLTDSGTGNTSAITFTNAMNDTNYTGSWFTNANTGSGASNFSNGSAGGFGDRVTASYGVFSYTGSAAVDSFFNDSIIMGDLA